MVISEVSGGWLTTQSNEPDILAAVVVPLLTGAAGAVEDGWPHNGLLSRPDVGDPFPNLFDDAAELVAHCCGVCRAGEAVRLIFRGDEYRSSCELVEI